MELALKRKMEADCILATPASAIDTLRNNEDSGYHTSFTPGSVDFNEDSNENMDPNFDHSLYYFQPLPKRRRPDFIEIQSSPLKKARKRHAQDQSISFAPTPTSHITGSLQNLNINRTSNVLSSDYLNPTTPVKKIRTRFNPSYYYPKSSPKKSSPALGVPKKSIKKLNFEVQDTVNYENDSKKQELKKLITEAYKNRQTDFISKFYLKSDTNSSCISPVTKVLFSFLDSKDIYNFSQVCTIWRDLCKLDINANRKLKEYLKFINNNKENDDCPEKKKVSDDNKEIIKTFKESNLLNVQSYPVRSPPGTPRTIKFKKFTKSASLDSRVQLSCVRCRQPAKVTKEDSGEEWAECSSGTCSFQFCKKCNCERHPYKKCFQYDLEAPSPSKRKRSIASICTIKSKRNLRRL